MTDSVKTTIASIFNDLADGLETGSFGEKPRIALTGLGSEHGEETTMAAAQAAAKAGIEVSYIGQKEAEGVKTVFVEDDEAGHKKMDELLDAGEVDGAVTMHYPFPIGVSTVGRAVTPGKGKEMYLANTTGTSSTDLVEGMVRNAIYGIAVAKACGNPEPTVGILNLNGARQVEIILKELSEQGYPIHFAESARADGGCIMRGNDVLLGSADIMVCDSLTGNVISKLLSSFTSGGAYETLGAGYGPGIGEDYRKLIMIISRASGAPVIENAIRFAADLVHGHIFDVAAQEFALAKKAGLEEILEAHKPKAKEADEEEVTCPPHEVVTAQVPGIEVMDLEDGVKSLWKAGIYAESGMGCTGPVILVSEANFEKAKALLTQGGYIVS